MIRTFSPRARAMSYTSDTAVRQAASGLAVVLGGSRARRPTSDVASDYDLYVYTVREVAGRFFDGHLWGRARKSTNRFWDPATSGAIHPLARHIDIMYRSALSGLRGKSSAFYRVTSFVGIPLLLVQRRSIPKHYLTREVWYQGLQNRCRVAYPEGLRSAVLRKNWPVLRRNHSSYRHQIEVALIAVTL